MSGAQTSNGKGFEYAVAEAAMYATGAPIDFDEPTADRARKAFNALKPAQQRFLRDAAAAAISNILSAEKDLKKNAVYIGFHSDADGVDGYVEDVTIYTPKRAVGISVKYNHDDTKHPRLSDADFAAEWGMRPHALSRPTAYQKSVDKVIKRLVRVRKANPNFRWSDFSNKVGDFYLPVLTAFTQQIRTLHKQNACRTATEMFKFSVGRNDFYKVRLNATTGSVLTQAFNMNGTLSRKIPVTPLPTRILAIRDSETNLAAKIVDFDNGVSLKYRIHNGDGTVRQTDLKLSVSVHGHIDGLWSKVDYVPVPIAS